MADFLALYRREYIFPNEKIEDYYIFSNEKMRGHYIFLMENSAALGCADKGGQVLNLPLRNFR